MPRTCARSGCGTNPELTEAQCLAFKNSHSSPSVAGGVSVAWGIYGAFAINSPNYPLGCQLYSSPQNIIRQGRNYNRIMFNRAPSVSGLYSGMGTNEHSVPICGTPD